MNISDPPPAPGNPATKFQDFDREDVFHKAVPHTENLDSQNFVVEFGPERARIAFNLGASDIGALLKSEKDKNYPIRWINIWNPRTQKKAMEVIGNHYEFSERLIRLMCLPAQLQSQPQPRRHRGALALALRHSRRHGDVESGHLGTVTNNDIPLESHSSIQLPKDEIELDEVDDDNMELYLQVKNTVNYFSTDQTQKALCIGAHWLHKRPTAVHEHENKSMMPPKHWQWLAICNDHTVLSIHEQPSFELVPEKEDRDKWRAEELRNMRANTLDVLRQLSKKGFDLYKKKPLSINSVRRPLSKWHGHTRDSVSFNRQDTGMSSFVNAGEPVSLADEGTSNLFYYLFEDYVAAGPLKTAEKKLEHITTKVLDSARPKIRNKSRDIIPTLHYLSKDLRELKHLFENYRNLISKITALGKADAQAPNGHGEDVRKVMLTDTALSRFDRLGDRLQYLMLNSIEGYLGEISAVSSTYFNLTQQKDSEATARLTRSATLLAKLSVFFLPISFLTSYFSVQIEDLYMYWHGTDYWYSFAVIASVSFVSLFFFSRLLMFFSDTLDMWATQSVTLFRKVLGLKAPDDDDDE